MQTHCECTWMRQSCSRGAFDSAQDDRRSAKPKPLSARRSTSPPKSKTDARFRTPPQGRRAGQTRTLRFLTSGYCRVHAIACGSRNRVRHIPVLHTRNRRESLLPADACRAPIEHPFSRRCTSDRMRCRSVLVAIHPAATQVDSRRLLVGWGKEAECVRRWAWDNPGSCIVRPAANT